MEERKAIIEKHLNQPSEWNCLACECLHCAASVGFVVGAKNDKGEDGIRLGSITCVPSLYPKSIYEEALALQPLYNELYHKISHDHQYMKQALSSAVAGDEFTARLWKTYETVYHEGFGNPLSLGIFRSDYMYQLMDGKFSLAQIELNTIASSMAMLSTQAQQVHRYLGDILPKEIVDASKIPENNSIITIANGIIRAWELYGQKQAVVLIVMSEGENNFADIRRIQYEIVKLNREVKVVARTAEAMRTCASKDDDKRLIVDGKEVALVYFRTYYSPDQYSDESDWGVRLIIEQSKAMKCPSIQYQLAGSKKIQQDLARPGVVERFLDTEKSRRIRTSFVGLYSLEENPDIIEKALQSPENFVLKPQREGGGNNFYGEDIVPKLKEICGTSEMDAYILMDRVRPPAQYNCKLTGSDTSNSNCTCTSTVSELGIYGTVIGSSDEIIENNTAGYLLRTKAEKTNEGGFYVGHSSIDTPQLLTDRDMISFLSNKSA